MTGGGSTSETPDRDGVLHLRFLIGVSTAMLSNMLSSIGFVMQRRAHLGAEEPWSTKLWAAGVFVYICAAPLDVISYAEAPQIVCVAATCLKIVMVSVLAYAFLKEKVGRRELFGIFVVSVGTFLCMYFGPRPIESNTAEPHQHGSFTTYAAIVLCILGVLLTLEHHDLLRFRLAAGWHYFTLPAAAGMALALGKAFNTELGLRMHARPKESGTRIPIEWRMGVMVAICGLLSFYLNLRGAKLMPVQAFVPVVFAFSTLMMYLQSGIIFDEFSNIGQMSKVLSMLGAAMALFGALLIQPPVLPVEATRPPLIELAPPPAS